MSLIEARGFAGLVVLAESSGDPAVAPFIGSSRLGRSVVVAGRSSAPLLGYLTPMEREEAAATGLDVVAPETHDVARWSRQGATSSQIVARITSHLMRLSGMDPSDGPLALAGRPPAGDVLALSDELASTGWVLRSGEGLMRRFRKKKSAGELAELQTTCAFVERAFRRLAEVLTRAHRESRTRQLSFEHLPLTLGRLRREIDSIFAQGGLEQPEGAIVAAEAQAAIPHSVGDHERVLSRGEALIVDLFPRKRLFADCSRTFCVGNPAEALVRAHRVVTSALSSAVEAATAGTVAWSLQERVCRKIQAAGYATPLSHPGTTSGYVHGLGHGVGYELHELPVFAESDSIDGVLQEGDVFTLEPGLYDPREGWGVRLEDLFLMTSGGAAKLIDLPYELDPSLW